MPNRDDVEVRVGGDNRGLDKALKEANKMVSRFSKVGTGALSSFTDGIGKSIKSVFSLRGAVATLAGTGGLGLLIKTSIASADQIAKTADKVGLGIEALQEYRFAAQLAGVSQSTFDMAIQRFSRRVGEAAQGTGELKDTLKQYGIEVRNSDGTVRSLEAVLNDYSDAVANAKSGQEQLRLSFKGFDSEGAALVNLLRRGSAGMEELRQEARDLGVVLDRVMVREAERAGDELARVGQILRTNVTRAVLSLTPQILALSEALVKKFRPAVEWLVENLPATAVASDELRRRLAETRKEIEQIVGPLTGDIMDAQIGDLGLDAETEQRLVKLATRYGELSLKLDERLRKEELLKLGITDTGNANDFAASKTREVAEALQFELDQLSRSETEQRLYTEARKAGIEVTAQFREEVGGLVGALQSEKQAMDAAKTASKETEAELKRLKEAGEQVFVETRTDAESFALEMERLKDLVDRGAISWDTYGRAVEKAQDELGKTNDLAKETDKLFDNVSVTMSSGFADAILEGKRLSDVFKSLAQDVAKLVIQTLLLRAVQSGISAIGGALGGGGSGVTASQAGAIGSVAPATTAGIGFEKGGAWDKGVRFMARGGVLNSPTAFMDSNGPAVAGEAGPEAVLPLRRGKGGMLGVAAQQQAANVQVIVYPPPDTQTSTRESTDSRGGKTIEVLIDEVVSNAIGDQRTRTNRTLRQNFNLSPATIGR
ncbi:MAG: hypothetical protein AAF942_00055 [Pseudomonadota bacterium]